MGKHIAELSRISREIRKSARRPSDTSARLLIVSTLPIESQKSAQIRLTLNGEETDVSFAAYKTLLEVLREDLGHTGTKHGCELGECGACAVLLDGKPVLSCLVLPLQSPAEHVLPLQTLRHAVTL